MENGNNFARLNTFKHADSVDLNSYTSANTIKKIQEMLFSNVQYKEQNNFYWPDK